MAKRWKKYYDIQKSKGLCVRCKDEAEPGKTLCAKHRIYNNRENAASHIKYRAERLEKMRQLRQKRIERGECQRCGKKLVFEIDGPNKDCLTCNETKNNGDMST
jgi:very-short-patch-repair endonuclease